MRNQIDLGVWNVERFMKDVRGLLAHDNQPVRKSCNLVHHRALVGIWIAQDGVQRGDKRHVQPAQEFQNMRARTAAKDSIFMLQANQIDIAEIQEVGGLAVGRQIILGQFEAYPSRITVALFGIVHRKSQQLRRAVFRMNGVAQIGCECRNSTMSWKIVANDGDAVWKSGALRSGYRRGRRCFQADRFHFN